MWRDVSSGVLKRSFLVSVFFNLDKDIEGEFLKFVADTRMKRRDCVEDYRISIQKDFSLSIWNDGPTPKRIGILCCGKLNSKEIRAVKKSDCFKSCLFREDHHNSHYLNQGSWV